MYFEILLLCCTGLLLCQSVRKKQYAAICAGIPLLILLFYQKSFNITELLYGCAVVNIIFCIRLFARAMPCVPLWTFLALKIMLVMVIYCFVVSGYEPVENSKDIGKEAVLFIFFIMSVLLFFSEKIKEALEKCSGLFMVLVFVVPVWGFYIIERIHNTILNNMDWLYITGNIFFLALLYICIYCVFPYKKFVAGLFLTVCLIFGLANYYVTQFKGNPVTPSDILSLNTAFQVAGGYEFNITSQVIIGILNWYAALILLCCLPIGKAVMGWKIKAIICSVIVVLCVDGICNGDIEERYQLENINQWSLNSFYNEKGSVLGFTELVKKLKTDKPNGYSIELAQELLKNSISVEDDQMRQTVEPTIIVVMDETFSDLRSLGNFTSTEEYLEEWYAVDDFACRGKLYVSVYGGNTANSEFEFLTGNSMANCAPGIIPYQIYNLKNVGNLAGLLAEEGYTTTAIHPQYKGNWNRMRTYANFGFGDFLGIEDFENPRYIRSLISDESSFDKIIEIYEQNSEKQFIFNVTMQNHGGYSIDDMAGMDIIKLKKKWEQYTDVETYLTLIRESDKAIVKLLDYFRQVNEPVIICIFGDHHPSVSAEWIEDVMGKSAEELSLEETERKFEVPYMIWANFSTPYEQCEMDTSVNYLGALLLKNAGLGQSAYTSFLLQMREEIPVINIAGYQTNDGIWHTLNDADSGGWLTYYRIVQYYAMFDNSRIKEYFWNMEKE